MIPWRLSTCERIANSTPCHNRSMIRNALTLIHIKPNDAPERPVFHRGLSFAWFCSLRESFFFTAALLGAQRYLGA
jgi:hypothetical protein